MDRFSTGRLLILFLFLMSVGRSRAATITCEYVGVTGGGCPDLDACGSKCKGCYAGVGRVLGACLSKGSGQPEDECRCYFLDGAPCIPDCLRPPAASHGLPPSTGPAYNNGTHVIIG